MNELLVGTSHRVASVEYLEAAMRAADALWSDLASDRVPIQAAGDVVLLRTCNRVELYATPSNERAQEWRSLVHERVFAPAAAVVGRNIGELSYVMRGHDAARHLCRVAAGLDSLVIGESQIVGQVAQAFSAGLTSGSGNALSDLAACARRASKRVRSETQVGRAPSSVSTAAIDMVAEELGTLEGASILVIGAGKVGQLTCEEIIRRGAARVSVMSRTLASARALADKLGLEAADPSELSVRLAEVDAVFTAVGSDGSILPEAIVRDSLKRRNGRGPLVVADLAVPRDVAPGVRNLPGVTVFDLDDLRPGMPACPKAHTAGIKAAESIVADEVARYERASLVRRMEPLIVDLRRRAEDIRSREVRRALQRNDGDSHTHEQLERFSKALVNKLLHQPTATLRECADHPDRENLVDLTRELFGLRPADPDGERTED